MVVTKLRKHYTVKALFRLKNAANPVTGMHISHASFALKTSIPRRFLKDGESSCITFSLGPWERKQGRKQSERIEEPILREDYNTQRSFFTLAVLPHNEPLSSCSTAIEPTVPGLNASAHASKLARSPRVASSRNRRPTLSGFLW